MMRSKGSILPVLTDFDAQLFIEGNHYNLHEKLGAHPTRQNGEEGTAFAVWAPNAREVSVVGHFNGWQPTVHRLEKHAAGIWFGFISKIGVGESYKFAILGADGILRLKADPFAFQSEVRPGNASIVADLTRFDWSDHSWIERRSHLNPLGEAISVYEVHLGSWKQAPLNSAELVSDATSHLVRVGTDGQRFLTYRELAETLVPYVRDLGYTHIELLPICEHPLDASWGYQTTGYFAATSRYGNPHDLMYFIDTCHRNGLGVIVDWVPAHFPLDEHGLIYFDGSHLFEHPDPLCREMRQWGTAAFHYERNEVRNFLISSALFWIEKYHVDGFRVDAVAYMIYHDYCRAPGEWMPNRQGGVENLGAIDFLQTFNNVVQSRHAGVFTIAEDSSAWPGVTSTARRGGLGFTFKWNMGWMHDILQYFERDPVFRKYHHNNITFSIWYAFSENFLLALSHDEVVHGKRNLIEKMPGDAKERFANLRALFSMMYCHPGKKTLFMGMEFAQIREWSESRSLDWYLLGDEAHLQIFRLIKDLNRLYRSQPALYTQDFTQRGFSWIDCNDSEQSVVSYLRIAAEPSQEFVVVVANFTPVPRPGYRIGVPHAGYYREIFNSDAACYGGSNCGNLGGVTAHDCPWHTLRYSIEITLPPLGVLVFTKG